MPLALLCQSASLYKHTSIHTLQVPASRARAPVKPVAALKHSAPQDGDKGQGRGATAIAARKRTAKAAKAVLPPAAQSGKQPIVTAGQKRKAHKN